MPVTLRRWLPSFAATPSRRPVAPRFHLQQLEDRDTPATFVVTNSDDSGVGSFRQAILEANGNPGADSIVFAIPGSGVQSISPLSTLPTITDAVTIDGWSQPGWSGTPLIELNGASVGGNAAGVTITGPNVTIRGLVINRFAGSGVLVSGPGAVGAKVQGNWIGLGTDGDTVLANGNSAVFISDGASGTVVGVDGDGVSDAAEGNTLVGNTSSAYVGVGVSGIGTNRTVIAGNRIGTNSTGTAARGRFADGININTGAKFTRVGTNGDGISDQLERNVIGNAQFAGVAVYNDGTDDTIIAGNYVGLGADGATVIANGFGVGLGFSSVTGPQRTRIGTDGNGNGFDANERNVISGNGTGVLIGYGSAAGVSGTVISGNFIGTDATGHLPRGNSTGVSIGAQASNTTIGGTTPFAGNLISGNTSTGVQIDAAVGSNTSILGNRIGTKADGTAALGNFAGVIVFGNGVTVGGVTPGTGNLIAGNTGYGAWVGGSNNSFYGNQVGSSLFASPGVGVYVNGSNQRIGGLTAGTANVITNHTLEGVSVFQFDTGAPTSGVSIRGNSIFGNGRLGIDLLLGNFATGVTPNDALDTDTGPNGLMNFPTITTAVNGPSGRVVGTFGGAANATVTLDFYASAAADPSGHGEGQRYLGSTAVVTDASGIAAFDATLPAAVAVGEWLTATATDALGNTSEFSLAVNANPLALSNSRVPENRPAGALVGTLSAIDPDLSALITFSLVGGAADNAQFQIVDNELRTAATFFTELRTSYTVVVRATDAGGLTFDKAFTVSVTDVADLFAVVNTQDSGVGSLRQAMLNANARPGADTVVFAIPGTGVRTISPLSALPVITDAVTIDGTSQPGYAGLPLIEVSGTRAGANVSGFTVSGASDVTIRGLAINLFSANGIQITGGTGVALESNHIGTDASGTNAFWNGAAGVFLSGTAGVRIGTVGAGNLISGNTIGVLLSGANADTRIQGNTIGMNRDGTTRLANTGNGVSVQAFGGSVTGLLVGGEHPGEGNLISGNGSYGFLALANDPSHGVHGTRIQGNIVGLDRTGTTAFGNGVDGVTFVAFVNGVTNMTANVVGGNTVGSRNVISGNATNGVRFSGAGAFGNVVAGNFIGTDASGTVARGNAAAGVRVDAGARDTTVGTDGNGMTDAAERNVIGGNSHGVIVVGSGTNRTVIAGNYIGTNAAGTGRIANAFDGVLVTNGPADTRIGTDGNGNGFDANERNVISGNGQEGVQVGISGQANSARTVIAGNYIGTNAAGTGAIANGFAGINLWAVATDTRIGTDGNGVADDAERNVISGNAGEGIMMTEGGVLRTVIAGNYIGTNAAGTAALANRGTAGVLVSNGPDDTRIGTDGNGNGFDANERNVISGNTGEGIQVEGGGTLRTVIAGNYVGVNAAGDARLANVLAGMLIWGGAANTRVGTNGNGIADGAERNVISGNSHGVIVRGTTDTVVAGNFIGTNADGTAAIGNTASAGIYVDGGAQRTRIGTDANGNGFDANERNVVSGNAFEGIRVYDNANATTIAGNYIGTSADGSAAVPNRWYGVWLFSGARSTRIGTNADGVNDSLEANLIAFNGRDGVAVVDATTTRTWIRGNSIFSNGGLGIDLADNGVTANDALDADTGPNGLMNFPVISVGERVAGGVRFTGTFSGAANATITLDFYASAAADPSGYGEGQRYLGSTIVVTDASGIGTFDVTLTAAVAVGEWLTATATDALGNTSEFSLAVRANTRPDVSGGPFGLAENRPSGTAVGSVSGNDADGDPLTYAIVGGNTGGAFAIDPATGAITVANAAALDFETNPTFALTVQASDGTLTATATVTIDLTNVNEVTGFDVQKGQRQRSFVRYQDIAFESGTDLAALLAAGRIRLTRFDLAGNNGTSVSLTGRVTVTGNTLAVDFGPQGIGGNRNTIAGDGYYTYEIDTDGDGTFETARTFYRLFGDVTGDQQVTQPDAAQILAALGTPFSPENDVNGDGVVNAIDRNIINLILVQFPGGRRLTAGWTIDD